MPAGDEASFWTCRSADGGDAHVFGRWRRGDLAWVLRESWIAANRIRRVRWPDLAGVQVTGERLAGWIQGAARGRRMSHFIRVVRLPFASVSEIGS